MELRQGHYNCGDGTSELILTVSTMLHVGVGATRAMPGFNSFGPYF